MSEPQRLERITLDSRAISFNRLRSTSAIYYHWHQCVEFLYISSGYGIVVVDNQHYTARPGRLFIFPPFRLHKVQVDHSEKNPYHRTTMHIEQSVVESIMGGVFTPSGTVCRACRQQRAGTNLRPQRTRPFHGENSDPI